MESILKTIFAVAVCISTVSCENTINRSVTEPMTIEEIKDVAMQFGGFGNVYDQIYYVVSYMSPAKKAEFVTLTYADYYKFQKEITEKDAEWNDIATKEWQKKHGWKVAHIDSVYYYWKQRREDYLENHKLVIEPVAYSIKEDHYYGSKHPVVSIRITSGRGEISHLHAVFAIENKDIDNFDNILNYYYCIGLGGHNDIYVKEPVREITLEPRRFQVMGDYFDSEDFSQMSFDELNSKYKFDYKVCRYELTEKAIAAEKKLLPIPEWAERKLGYNEGLKYTEDYGMLSFYKNAIEKELNETFESLEKYKQSYVAEKRMSVNAMAYNLYEIINKK